MDTRPKIKGEVTTVDTILNVLGILLLLTLWGLVLYQYNKLPETINTHFDAAGKVDGRGSKNTLLILPAIGTITFIILSVLNNYPHLFNFPVKLTEENVQRQYTLACRLIRLLNAGLMLSLVIALYAITSAQSKEAASVGMWLLPMILIVTTLPIVYYFLQARKAA